MGLIRSEGPSQFVVDGVTFDVSADAIAGIKQSAKLAEIPSSESAGVGVASIQWHENPFKVHDALQNIGTSLATLEFSVGGAQVIEVHNTPSAVRMQLPLTANASLTRTIVNLLTTIDPQLVQLNGSKVEYAEPLVTINGWCDSDADQSLVGGFGVVHNGTHLVFYCGETVEEAAIACTNADMGAQLQCPTTTHSLECVFWNESTSSYSHEGCSIVSFSTDGVICECNPYQHVGTEKHAFDDRQVAAKALANRIAG